MWKASPARQIRKFQPVQGDRYSRTEMMGSSFSPRLKWAVLGNPVGKTIDSRRSLALLNGPSCEAHMRDRYLEGVRIAGLGLPCAASLATIYSATRAGQWRARARGETYKEFFPSFSSSSLKAPTAQTETRTFRRRRWFRSLESASASLVFSDPLMA